MISKASVEFIRISPRKVRYVIDLIRKKTVVEAMGILAGSPRRAGGIVQKLLNQAVDAAEKNSQIEGNRLYVSKVTADGGPTMKRFRPMSMGRAGVIRKRTSHIYLELDMAKHQPAPVAPKTAGRPAASKAPVTTKAAGKKAPVKKIAKKLAGAK